MSFAAQYVTIDISYLRWLWWPIILYLFWGMAFVCDVYFVRTIDVISSRFHIPDDVAGATLMALGCNGPELALNTIAIFCPSNIGVGAVVGGEVFNVLVIIGTALLATPDAYMPLRLGRVIFFRDVGFYVLSVALLYWVLADGDVSRVNAAALMAGCVAYTTTVVLSERLSRWLRGDTGTTMVTRMLTRMRSRRSTWRRRSWLPHSGSLLSGAAADDDDDSDSDEEPDPETVECWEEAVRSADPFQGSVLDVRVDIRNRLMDRGHRAIARYIWLRDDALLVSTVMDPRPTAVDKTLQKNRTGIAYDHQAHGREQHWHHGGLVNQPLPLVQQNHLPSSQTSADKVQPTVSSKASRGATRPLLVEKASFSFQGDGHGAPAPPRAPPVAGVPGFKEAPWEVIPLEDILYCERAVGEKMFNLHVHQHDSALGSLITLEMSAETGEAVDCWVSALRGKLMDLRRRTADAPPAPTALDLLREWSDWLQFPVKFWVARTIPDMDNPKLQHLYPVSFSMSMFWLAIFAYSVVEACDGISKDFGISTAVLGFTVAAAGTSFPNVFSGMCVARQGKTSMAIANALGANVQNVFLALAVPWAFQSFCLTQGPFPMVVDDLRPAVVECGVTLMPVVLIYICCNYSLPRWSGTLFLIIYVVYAIIALGQQVSRCPLWPLPCDGW